MNILVLHGPNLDLLGERPGDEKGRPLEELNGLIRARAGALGLSVKVFQSNHEGALIDTLHAERRWAQGIIINPGALTHYSYALREAVAAVDRPTLEVHLTDIRRRESWRRKSVLKDICKGQVLGKGFDSYLIALERFVTGDLAGKKRGARPMRIPPDAPAARKTLGPATRKEAPPPTNGHGATAIASAPAKTLGRRAEFTVVRPPAAVSGGRPEAKTLGRTVPKKGATGVLTRAIVRQKIAERLAGKLSPSGLATWARAQWLDVQRGAPAESGQRELLEDSLQSLVLSAMPPSKMSDDQLIELMTQLEA
jgi:3-dehydroquinate dehydratase-2